MKVNINILHTVLVLIIVSVNIITSRSIAYKDRSARSRQNQKSEYVEEWVDYVEQNRDDDPWIDVIVDPTEMKAVAMIENDPAKQLDYDTELLHNSADSKLLEFDTGFHGNDAADISTDSGKSAGPQKRKRNTDLKKTKMNNVAKLSADKGAVTQEYTESQEVGVSGKDNNNKAKAAENCPPHLEEKARAVKRDEWEVGGAKENAVEKNTAKRETGNRFSQSQIYALTASLSTSLAKVKDARADMESLRHMLHDMRIVRNDRGAEDSQTDTKLEASTETALSDTQKMKRVLQQQQEKQKLEASTETGLSEAQQTIRYVQHQQQQDEMEDVNMNRDNIVMKRTDAQYSVEDEWQDDPNEQLDKSEVAPQNAVEDEQEAMAEESMEINNPDNSRTLMKRENAEDDNRMNGSEKAVAKENEQGNARISSKRAVRSAGEESYTSADPNFRSANEEHSDSEAPVRRCKCRLKSVRVNGKPESHDVRSYVLNRGKSSGATVAPDQLTLIRNSYILSGTVAKELDPIYVSYFLKPHIRVKRVKR